MKAEIVGHEKILDFFAKVVEHGRLSHAYCFIGPESVGKRTVAEKLAGDLLGTNKEKLFSHPDFVLVEQEFSEKKEKTNKDINIEQIRNLRQTLARHAYLGGYKVAIIDKAEKLNSEAANALLKTLEEPADKTILFIITRDQGFLPATIVSRCQMVFFEPVPQEKISKSWSVSEEQLNWSLGLPGKIRQWQEDPTAWQEFQNEVSRFHELLGKSFFDKQQLIEVFFKEVEDNVANRDRLQEILNLWLLLLRNIYFKKYDLPAMTGSKESKWNGENVPMVEEKIISARNLLRQNVNPRLIFDNILLTLP